MFGYVFFFVCHDGGEWVGGERWFVTGFQWVEAGNAGKHSIMHGTGLCFFNLFLYFNLLVKESAVFVFWPYK